MEITRDIIIRFIENKATPEECDALADWIESSESNRELFEKELHLHIALINLLGEEETAAVEQPKRNRLIRLVSFAAGVAAVVVLTVFVTWKLSIHPAEERMLAQKMSITSEKGHQATVTLSDGTKVRLNAETTLYYPVVFGKTREVYVDGEALFDVAKDAEHPFVVNTYSYKVTVTGTRFNVLADESRQKFATALVEGSVSVSDHDGGKIFDLVPGEVAFVEGGTLQKKSNEDISLHTLWTEGVVTVDGVPFDELMMNIAKSYGVDIVIDRTDLPEVNYGRMKLKVSDGIEHALQSLQRQSDFTYYFDHKDNTYHIQ